MKNKLVSFCIIFLMVLITVFSIKPIINSINFGLDLKGGFEVLYEVSSLDGTEEVTDDMLVSTYKAISNRIDTLGVSEPVITIEGTKIRVQLPGVTDEDAARERLSTPAVLTFRNSSDELLMTSSILNSPGASLDYNETGKAVVALKIKDNDTFYRVTKSVSESEDKLIVIWLDFVEGENSFLEESETCGSSNKCISSATVGEAFADNVVIEGNFTVEEAQSLVDLINSGSLPTKLEEISTKTVDASFGEGTLKTAAVSGVVTLVLITVLMSFFYRLSGFISSICLMFYAVITFAVFNAIDGVLTLTGIAALILGVGMAVDSSIVTLEKIKDEIRNGKKLPVAFQVANKRSLISLIDANITTFIVAVILFIFGESSVKGFGSMLIITIIVTMLTMVFINRYVLKLLINENVNINVFLGKVNKLKQRDFMRHSFKVIIGVVVILVVSVIMVFVNGVNLGVDFKGGTSITIKSNEAIDEEYVGALVSEYNVVNSFSDEYSYELVLSEIIEENEIKELKSSFDEEGYISDISVISNIVKKDLASNAIKSVLIAFVSVFIYISIRFKSNYGTSGLVALVVDIVMVMCLFVLFKIEVNFIFIAAILTIIGYSINDTIVIFDLIRENKKINKKMNNREIINISLSTAFKRSVLTSITTAFAVITLLILGAEEIKEFNLAILFGLVVGTFSSLFIAPYVWLKLDEKKKDEKDEEFDDGPEEKLIKGINS